MRPSEALPQDWPLYYQGTYMLHEQLGPVSVAISDGGLVCKKIGVSGNYNPTSPEYLSVWFPRKGAFNTKTSCVYIGRRAARQMRKSMTIGDLYYVSMGERINKEGIVALLAEDNPKYIRGAQALRIMRESKISGRAISRDIMLWRDMEGSKIKLIYKGIPEGVVMQSTQKVALDCPNGPKARIIRRKLLQEGILCISTTR